MAGWLMLAIPIVAFVALVLIFTFVLRRTGRIVGLTREVERFRRSVDDLSGRIDTSLGGVIDRIDAVRRQQVPPDSIGDNLAAARDAVERYEQEASKLHGPVPADDVRAALLAELERAGRALEMVAHGCDLLSATRSGYRELEAQTAVKRGYLNALHAREAIAAALPDLSDATADLVGWVSNGQSHGRAALDLPLAIALASSFRDRPVREGTVAIGEVGLLGELRSVSGLERRLREAARLGFSRAIVPRASRGGQALVIDGLEVVAVATLREALERALA